MDTKLYKTFSDTVSFMEHLRKTGGAIASFAVFAALTSCAMPGSVQSYAPSGKSQYQFAQEDAYCNQQTRGAPLDIRGNEYGICMHRLGNDVRLADGRLIAGYVAPPPIPRYVPAPPQIASEPVQRYRPGPDSMPAPSYTDIPPPMENDAPNPFTPSPEQVRQAFSDAAWTAGKDCALAYVVAKYNHKEDEFSSASCFTKNLLANLALSAVRGAAYVEICRRPPYLQSILGADKTEGLASAVGCGSATPSAPPAIPITLPPPPVASPAENGRHYGY